MRRSAALSVVTCVSLALCAAGCLERKSARVGPNVGVGQSVQVGNDGVSAVDLLFVIDNSGSMSQEQANLAVQIPALVRDLASPPDRDGDGTPDWNAAKELRIGIITTDTGIGSTSITGSRCEPGGEQGRLRGTFTWREGDDASAFAAQVGDVVEGLGIVGCAFEQPLEAAALAVAQAPSTGFPREDSLFALIVVTDEEDCSVVDDDAFFSDADATSYNVHCVRHADRLTPPEALLEQIRGPRDEASFVFAAIAGLPRDLPANATPAQILARPDMEIVEETTERGEQRLRAVCEFTNAAGDSLGRADPARRLIQLGALVPESVLTTICTDDFGPAIERIAARIGAEIPGVCLARAIPEGEGNQVPCEATVTLPAGESCGAYPGYTASGLDERGRPECALAQVSAAQPSGFYYDPDRDGCAQLVITDDALPPLGSEVAVECFFSVLRPEGEQCARDSQCESSWCDRVSRLCAPLPEVPSEPTPPTGG